ncbi:hypothetical protein AURDEDRAFT_110707 [Auricularia subglabra TFB-10046 SS5]|nr:hypothetical protein AURDEDRAFT_110707 [Auricularia subglabra TFB-10046 SS5]
MSWNQPSYRSRSRSPPYRGQQYPPPDAGGPPPPPPPRDWDDRDRGWDRRDSYRGRSRSPGGGDYYGDRKRRRSPSPYDRGDRHEPRPRYADDYDTHTRSRAYSPNRDRRYGMGNGRRREFADPYAMDSPASFKQFAEWFRHTYPTQTTEDDIADKIAADANEQKPKMMRVRYEKYKKEFHCRQVQTLFDYHRKSPWFQERYDPSPQFENLRKRVRKQGWGGRLEQFLVDIEGGKYDPNPDELAPTDATNGDGGDPPSSPVKEEPDVKQEDADQQFDEDAGGDDNEGGRRNRDGARVQRSDEISISPEGNEVMIRTIPPDIGRLKLEDVLKPISGFMYLALGEPMQKRNYYRAGWIRFTDDTDMEKTLAELADKKIDGFKLHVSQSTRPFLTRIKNTPEVASRPDRVAKDLANVKLLAAKLEDEYFELRKFKENSLPASNGNSNGAAEGSDEPQVKSEDVPMGDVEPEPLERGSEAVERRIAKLVAELPEEPSEESETKKATIALDMYVAYVRAAFNTCYYCIAITDHVEELHRKCAGHRRKLLSKPAPPPAEGAVAEEADKAKEPEKDKEREREREDDKDRDRDRDARYGRDRERDRDGRNWQDKSDEQWVERLDMRIASLISRDKVDPKDYGGKDPDEELTKAVEPFIKQEDEGKFRCKTCSKLFKATSFVEKHIANKHSELVKQLDDLKVFNNFALDPQRIQPYTRVPAPIGNGQPLASQAFGLQGPVPAAPDFNNRGHPYQQQHPNSYPPPGYGDGPPPYRARSPPRRGGDRYFPSGPGFDSLPPKPSLGAEPMRGGGGRGGYRGGERGPPPPPPPDAKEDPRAAAGRKISYHDMDEVAEGDVELMY